MSRPVPIILAAWLQLIGGVASIVAGSYYLIMFPYTLAAIVFGPVMLIGGALYIVAAYGLWKLRKWGGYLSISLSILALIPSIIFAFRILHEAFYPYATIVIILFIYILYSGLIIIFVQGRWKRLIS